MENNLEKVLKDSFQNSKRSLEMISQSIQIDNEQAQILRYQILAKKEGNPKATFQDAKNELIAIQDLSYQFSFKEREISRHMALTAELYTIAKLAKIDLELSEEDEKNMRALLENTRSLFAVDPTTGEVHLSDKEMYENLIGESKRKNQTDEVLTQYFDSVQPIKK